jgi:regulator of sigma E protease
LLALLGLALLILAHEFGHFLTARCFGVRVEEFVIGLPGPKLIRFKKGETVYGVSIIPFGGYVRLFGEFYDPENPETATHPESFLAKSWLARVVIIAAGSIFNFILAILLFAAMFMYGVPGYPTTTVKKILPGSPAELYGIKPGDRILQIDNIKIREWRELSDYISKHPGKEVTLKLQRNSETISLRVILANQKGKGLLGVQAKTTVRRLSPVSALIESSKLTAGLLYTFLNYLVSELPKGTILQQSSGPVGIFVETSKAVKVGFDFYLFLLGLISVNLGIVNLLPIPPLDGGRILLLTLERSLKRKIPEGVLTFINLVGVLLVIYLIFYLLIADLKRYHLVGL